MDDKHEPNSLLVSEFTSRDEAERALAALKDKKYLDVEKAAIITKAMDGEVKVKNDDDVQPAEGALAGAGFGALVGGGLAAMAIPGVGPFLAAGTLGSALIGALAGGVTGGATAALVDMGFDDKELDAIKNSLARGNTVLVAEVEPDNQDRWKNDLPKYKGRPLI